MIQRIQTVYLLIIGLLSLAMFFLPFGSLQGDDTLYVLDVAGVSSLGPSAELVYPMWGLYALLVMITLIPFITIFLFKNRILQIRLSIFNGLLMVGLYAFIGYIVWQFSGLQESSFGFTPKLALGFPLISLILDYLAIRNIGADEALVRSLERLR